MRFWMLGLLGLVACGATPPVSETTAIENFHTVRDGVFRGGHPNASGMEFLDELGVRTIIDLEIANGVEADGEDITAELDDASKRGITVLRYPMSAFDSPDDEFDAKIDDIMKKLADPSLAPIYVHCAHGQDRTGLVIALERVIDEEWTPEAAHDEMITLGFHTIFFGLDHYFEEKSGWED